MLLPMMIVVDERVRCPIEQQRFFPSFLTTIQCVPNMSALCYAVAHTVAVAAATVEKIGTSIYWRTAGKNKSVRHTYTYVYMTVATYIDIICLHGHGFARVPSLYLPLGAGLNRHCCSMRCNSCTAVFRCVSIQ